MDSQRTPSKYEFHLPDYDVKPQGRSDLGESRIFQMSSNGWARMQRGLRKKFSSGASLILFEMGSGYGSFLATRLDHKGKSLNEIMQENNWGSAFG